MDLEKVRILVVGDSGVGKSSLVQLICHNQPMLNAGWTIGASVEVKIHDYKEGTPSQKSYFAEFWDIGGSVNHATSRHIFYNPVHGIILVHDLTNRKSHSNLRRWLGEVLNKDTSNNGSSRHYSAGDYDPEQFAGSHIPVLIIGTKQDQIDSNRQNNQSSSIAEECGADEINLDCTSARHLAPGSSNAVKLSRFLDKVIERRYFARDSSSGSQMTASQERRRISRQQFVMKTTHND